MKIQGKLFCELRALVESSPAFPMLKEYRAQDLTDKRYRWDCIYTADAKARTAFFDAAYTFADDSHIDAALRKITNTK